MVLKKMISKKIRVKKNKNKKKKIHSIRMKKLILSTNMEILPNEMIQPPNEINETEFMDKMIHFLADDYQLITLNKTDFMKSNIHHISPIVNEYKQYLEHQLIPILKYVNQEQYSYQFTFLYEYLDILPQHKKICVIKPISNLEKREGNKIELYITMEDYLREVKQNDIHILYENMENERIHKRNMIKGENDEMKYEIWNMNKNYKNKHKYDFFYIKKLNMNHFEKMIEYVYEHIEENGELMLDMSIDFITNETLYEQIQKIYIQFGKVEYMKSTLYETDTKPYLLYFKEFGKQNISHYDEFVENIRNENRNKMELYEKKIVFLKNEFEKRPHIKTFEKYYRHMIEKSYFYCKKHNIPVNEYYENYDKKFPEEMKYELFPIQKNVSMDKIKLTFESLYSVSHPKEAQQISDIIKRHYKNTKKVVDCTANIGGNTINFSKNFDKVVSIEIDEETYEALENNVQLYKCNNVSFILGDYIELFKNKDKRITNGDVYFFDPPWTGVYYKMYKNMDLYLSGVNVMDVLPEKFILKAPYNYNIQGLREKYPRIKVYKVSNYIVIVNQISFSR
jgi:16S rRNA G966 N2-methylase RsmD